ncbi:MAG: archaeosortase/exosortase family protein [Flavobacteriales bacterium]|nr:archaeosortase/exosortase family protein [Flavobacteriales bacterium]
MLERLKSNSKIFFLLTFFLKGLALYLFWVLLYEGWLINTKFVNSTLIRHLVDTNQVLLDFFGFTTFSNGETIGIDGSHGVFIGDPCNGLSLFALFTGFIIAFTGKIKYKIPFIILGILFIHLLNVVRIFALTLMSKYAPEVLDFNHKYTFTYFIYTIIFLLWMLWVKKYAQKE